ncbi:hypothetical protein [Streptomyces sp. NPDC059166]|uniref:hypothetical protein n=1 Tax=Streptomyces sp. NPDC059166 TaxID=3346752 RepID=UPI0036D0A21E
MPGGSGAGTLTQLFGGRGGGVQGRAGTGGTGSSGDGAGDDPDRSDAPDLGGSLDEAALRRMLQGAVHGLQPSVGSLDHLHRAVPARRARRRQGVVGAAAAALLIGTAVPAFVHVANSGGSVSANPAIAGHGEQAQGGSGEDAGAASDGEAAGPGDSRSETGERESAAETAPSQGSDPDAESTGASGLGASPGSAAAATTTCDPGQLGVASAAAGAPGADGTVYGTFKIANVSGDACSVTSNGTVGFQAAGAADPLKITVVQHTPGDPAVGLPDPSLEPGTVLLKPTMTYEVRFAWVPSDTCPTAGGEPSPTPTDGVGGGGDGVGAAEGAAADTAAQFGTADEGPADGSIAVTHTPEAGAPTAETTIDNACAGTIYRTGVLDPS